MVHYLLISRYNIFIINHNLTEGNTSGKTSFTGEKIKKSDILCFHGLGNKIYTSELEE